MEPRVVNSGRHPFEVIAMLGSVVVGGASVFGVLWPKEISENIPTWFNIPWGVAFALGSILTLVGVRMEKRSTGLLLEQVGLITLSALCWTNAAIMLILAHESYFPIAFLFTMLGVACLIQWVRIEVVVRAVIKRGGNITERIGE